MSTVVFQLIYGSCGEVLAILLPTSSSTESLPIVNTRYKRPILIVLDQWSKTPTFLLSITITSLE